MSFASHWPRCSWSPPRSPPISRSHSSRGCQYWGCPGCLAAVCRAWPSHHHRPPRHQQLLLRWPDFTPFVQAIIVGIGSQTATELFDPVLHYHRSECFLRESSFGRLVARMRQTQATTHSPLITHCLLPNNWFLVTWILRSLTISYFDTSSAIALSPVN